MRGLNNTAKREELEFYMIDNGIDLLIIQETHLGEDTRETRKQTHASRLTTRLSQVIQTRRVCCMTEDPSPQSLVFGASADRRKLKWTKTQIGIFYRAIPEQFVLFLGTSILDIFRELFQLAIERRFKCRYS